MMFFGPRFRDRSVRLAWLGMSAWGTTMATALLSADRVAVPVEKGCPSLNRRQALQTFNVDGGGLTAVHPSGLDALHGRIVQRLQRHPGRIASAGDVDLPSPRVDIVLVDGTVGFDHEQAHGPTQGVAV